MRLVSQEVLYTHNDNISLDSTLSHLLVEWGQWIDHDLALTPQSPSTAAFRTAVDCTRSCSRDTPCFPIQVTRPAPPRGHALPPPGAAGRELLLWAGRFVSDGSFEQY